MKIAFLILLLIASFTINAHADSGTVLNGGDAVMCKPESGSEFKGVFALDYLASYDSEASPIYPVRTLDESLGRISKLIEQKLPELHASFIVFAKNLLNRDLQRTYIWQPAKFGLIDVKDENLVSLLPMNCRNSDGSASLIQAIVRQPSGTSGLPGTKVLFAFQPEILKSMDPLQLSFLLVHEWLWGHNQNPIVNRMVNRFLHSKQFEQLPREKIVEILRQLSFVAPNDVSGILYPETCMADPKGLADLFPASGDRRVIEDPQLAESVYSCSANGVCETKVRADRGYVYSYFGGGYFVVASGNKIRFEVPGGNVRMDRLLECLVNVTTGQVVCGSLNDPNGQINFSGTMNRSCIRLEDQQERGAEHRTLVLYQKLGNSSDNQERWRRR
jgi:hypothetical protein